MKSWWQRTPLAVKIYLVCISLSLFFLVVGNAVIYHSASRSLRHEVRAKIESVAATAAVQIDPELHKKVRTSKDESGPTYRTLKTALIGIRKANPDIRYVYTMRMTGKKGVLEFVVDAEQDPKLISHVGDTFDLSDAPDMEKGFYGPASDNKINTDRWGTWLSGYAPIRDARGKTEAIIGLDMSAKQLAAEESELRNSVIRNLFFTAILALIFSFIITKVLIRPIRVFTAAARKIRSGDLDFRVELVSSPEITEFVDAFNGMIDGLKWTNRDILTGLCNHGTFHDELAVEISRAERFDRSMSLMLIDIDRFKDLNDTFGHAIGDSIVKQVADVLLSTVRKVDVPARYAGDEFAIILPETDVAAGAGMAERIRSAIETYEFRAVNLDVVSSNNPPAGSEQTVNVTVTIGISSYPNHHHTREGLIMAADISLCRAKLLGRNCVYQYGATGGGKCLLDPHDLYNMLHEPDSAAIRSLAAAVEAKDRYTHGHSERVTDYALRLAEALGMDASALDALKVAGLLHDLGKIGVPDAILNKKNWLTSEEREIVQSHPQVGGNILRRAPQLDRVIPAVVSHHERWDGSGYPNGLTGEQIPLSGRILAIADSFDAMTSDRPYRKAMPFDAAISEIASNAGRQFDPNLVEIFIRTMSNDLRQGAA